MIRPFPGAIFGERQVRGSRARFQVPVRSRSAASARGAPSAQDEQQRPPTRWRSATALRATFGCPAARSHDFFALLVLFFFERPVFLPGLLFARYALGLLLVLLARLQRLRELLRARQGFRCGRRTLSRVARPALAGRRCPSRRTARWRAHGSVGGAAAGPWHPSLSHSLLGRFRAPTGTATWIRRRARRRHRSWCRCPAARALSAVRKNTSLPFSLASRNTDSCSDLPEETRPTQPAWLSQPPTSPGSYSYTFSTPTSSSPNSRVFSIFVRFSFVHRADGQERIGAVEEQPAFVGEVARLIDAPTGALHLVSGDARREPVVGACRPWMFVDQTSSRSTTRPKPSPSRRACRARPSGARRAGCTRRTRGFPAARRRGRPPRRASRCRWRLRCRSPSGFCRT